MSARTGKKTRSARTTVQVSTVWLELAKKQADRRQQPTAWHLLSLIAAVADKEGDKRPALPWEREAEE